MKTAERMEARRLRREEGRSVKELAALPRVSRSTISLWVRDIDLTTSSAPIFADDRESGEYSKKKRRNKLPYGTCRLKISDTWLVHEIRGAIQEYGGFDREGWLM